MRTGGPYIIASVSCIAGGKTTLNKKLGAHFPNSETVFEPVEQWRKDGILEGFYKDPVTHAFAMQMYAFSSRLKALNKALDARKHEVIFMDGCIHLDKHVYKETLRQQGNISPFQDLIYRKTFRDWKSLVPKHQPVIYLHINTSAETCFERIKKRARKEEEGIPLSYLQALCDNANAMAEKFRSKGKTVITIDGNMTEDEVLAETIIRIKEYMGIELCESSV